MHIKHCLWLFPNKNIFLVIRYLDRRMRCYDTSHTKSLSIGRFLVVFIQTVAYHLFNEGNCLTVPFEKVNSIHRLFIFQHLCNMIVLWIEDYWLAIDLDHNVDCCPGMVLLPGYCELCNWLGRKLLEGKWQHRLGKYKPYAIKIREITACHYKYGDT